MGGLQSRREIAISLHVVRVILEGEFKVGDPSRESVSVSEEVHGVGVGAGGWVGSVWTKAERRMSTLFWKLLEPVTALNQRASQNEAA